MPIVIDSYRGKLRKYLDGQLKLMEKNGSPQAPLLRAAIEGLVALGYGESQPMFTPGNKRGSHDGTRPYTIRKLKMQALGFGDLLIANKYKPAIRTVSGAYGATAAAYRGWRKDKRLGKTTNQLMKSFREEVATRDWNETEVLDALNQAGKDYRAAKKFAFKSKK